MTFVSVVLAAFGFILLVVLHELGHFTAAKAVGMRVEKFSLFFPPTLASKKFGETEYAIGAIPAGGYVKITGMNPDEKLPDEVRTRAYYSQPVWKRMVVIFAGPFVNLVLAFVLFFVFFAAIGPETEPRTPTVGAIARGFPADGQLRPGDRVLAVDGRRGDAEALSRQIASHRCPQRPPRDRCRSATPATVVVERDARRLTLRLNPVYDATRGVEKPRLGFSYEPGPRDPLPLGRAFEVTAEQFWFVSRETVKIPLRVLDPVQRREISGIVGSYETTRQTILEDIAEVTLILGLISLSLAIVNLFPFLPLDGGHIFWAVVEKLRRGRPVPMSVMERSSVVGVVLVLALFAIGLSNDIGRLTGEGFQVR